MKSSSTLFILASLLLVLALKFSSTDAAALFNDDTMIDSNASEEIDGNSRAKKDSSISAAQQFIPSPLRRHHLKFGVLGKRHTFGYLGKRANEAQMTDDYEEWLNEQRERRAGRPQYGMLG